MFRRTSKLFTSSYLSLLITHLQAEFDAMFFYLFLFLTINISSAQIGHLGEQCANEISEPPCVVPNSICVKGFCKCAPFYRQYGKECISKDPSKTYGTKCTTSNDCSAIGEFCDTYGICKCLSNYLEISKTCRPIVYPGQYGCEDSRQCSVAHPGAICSIEGVCQCPNGFVPRSRDCISPVSISGFGNNHNERRYAPSRYRQAHIRMQHIPKRRPSSSDLNWSPNCPPGEVYVQEADLCMSTREPGEPCQYTQQCGGASSGTFCSRQRCECIYGMIISAEGCISSKRECHNIGEVWVAEVGGCKQILPPGSVGCTHSSQCSGAFNGSICFNQTCTCPPGLLAADNTCGISCPAGETYSAVSGVCHPVVGPGEHCQYSSQCSAYHPDTVCDRGKCRCLGRQVYAESACLEDCPDGTNLNENGICTKGCGPSEIEYIGKCYPKVGTGENCLSDKQCPQHATCLRGICECTPTLVARSGRCLPVEVPPQGECLNGELCLGGSECIDGLCKCPKGTVISKNQCILPTIATYGESCLRDDVICENEAVCVIGLCVCKPGRVVINGRCDKSSKVHAGKSCAGGKLCEGGSFCDEISLTCVCRPDQIRIGRQCHDRLRSHPGYPCNNQEICIGGSFCQDGVCVCPPRHRQENKQCVPEGKARPGEACDRGEVCVGKSTCDPESKSCKCPPNHKLYNKVCIPLVEVEVNGFCGRPYEKCVQFTSCLNGRCECNDGMKAIGQKCVRINRVLPGQACNRDDQCIDDSYCMFGKCKCIFPRIFRISKCVYSNNVTLGAPCEPGDKCLGMSECISGLCRCGSQRIGQGLQCVSKISGYPGYPCRRGVQCVHDSTCKNGYCECPEGMISYNRKCQEQPQSFVTEKCGSGEKCIGGSYCDYEDRVCKCPRGSTPIDGECQRSNPVTESVQSETTRSPTSLGQSRSTSDGFPGSNMEQYFSTYGFPYLKRTFVNSSGSYIVDSSTTTVSLMTSLSPGMVCDGKERFCSNGSICVGGRCECAPGYRFLNGNCVTPEDAPAPRRCLSNNHCPSGATCVNGRCKCPHGTASSRFGFCVPISNSQPETQKRSSRDPLQLRVGKCPLDDSCSLPNCYCSRNGFEVPGGLHPNDVPQMVLLTFAGPVNQPVINIYKTLFDGRFRNPNGCVIKGTFFITHEWNNYDQTQWLLSRGHEIAVNSITGEFLGNATPQKWHDEMVGMREALERFSYAPSEKVIGIRAPLFGLGGESQFDMMESSGFLYDNTIITSATPYWPQTLDFDLAWNCSQNGCPQDSYPGIWVIPLRKIILDRSQTDFVLLTDLIKRNFTRERVVDILYENFMRSYGYNRAPFVISLNPEFFDILPEHQSAEALEMFFTKVLNYSDVYMVTASQALKWIETPTRLLKIHNFGPWKCDVHMSYSVQPCENPSTCSFICDRGEMHSFSVCGSCPRVYPTPSDPLGLGN